jgi:hypothetical protein
MELNMERRDFMNCLKWLFITALIFCAGCTAASAPPKAAAASRELQDQFYIKSAEHYIKMRNFFEAQRFVDVIQPDSAFASRVPELKKQIDQLISDYDQAMAKRYKEEDSIPINLTAELKPKHEKSVFVEGEAHLPRYTRLNVSLWREDAPGIFQQISEEDTEIGPGSRFRADLSVYSQPNPPKEEVEKRLSGNFELRVKGYFRGHQDQPESVIKLVGDGGEKITGDWVEQKEAEGRSISFNQRYRLTTIFHPPDCLELKAEKY